MKKTHVSLKSRLFLLIALLGIIAQTASAQQSDKPFSINESPLPAPTGFVNDYAGVIDAATKQQLEAKIKAFRDKWNPPIELGVAIVKTTAERPIFDYSLAVARGWKIGSKEFDNPSALLLIAVDDRKYFTQISKDLQDELPDALAGQLQRQNLVPAFRAGNYGKGVSDTIDAFIKVIEAKQTGQPIEPVAEPEPQNRGRERSGGLPFGNCMTCLIILFVIMIIIFSSRGGGGGGGGFGGGRRNRYGGGGFGSALPWIIGSSIINSGGGSSGGWGGSSSGGSSGGGGFGGFGGGGDFDGGGAGGDW